MNWINIDWITIKDVIASLGTIAGVILGYWGIRSFILSRNQFHFDVMASCIERFQAILPKLDDPDPIEKKRAIKQYIDLCNEEMFYFQNNFLPEAVVTEWLDGMIDHLPWLKSPENNLNVNSDKVIMDEHLLDNSPRIKKAMQVDRVYVRDIPDERKELIEHIKQNLKAPRKGLYV